MTCINSCNPTSVLQVGTVLMPVLQMGKPRQREVKELAGDHTGSRAGTEMKIFTLNYSVSCLSEPGATRSPVGEPIQPASQSVTQSPMP